MLLTYSIWVQSTFPNQPNANSTKVLPNMRHGSNGQATPRRSLHRRQRNQTPSHSHPHSRFHPPEIRNPATLTKNPDRSELSATSTTKPSKPRPSTATAWSPATNRPMDLRLPISTDLPSSTTQVATAAPSPTTSPASRFQTSNSRPATVAFAPGYGPSSPFHSPPLLSTKHS